MKSRGCYCPISVKADNLITAYGLNLQARLPVFAPHRTPPAPSFPRQKFKGQFQAPLRA